MLIFLNQNDTCFNIDIQALEIIKFLIINKQNIVKYVLK